jgi:hypothetical protein
MAMMILGLLGGAVYSLSTAALETSKAVKGEYQACARLDAFLRVLRGTFVNLPPDALVYLQMEEALGGAPVPEIVFERAPGAFGVSSLGTGALALAAKPLSDGTREFALLLRQGREASFPTRIDTSGERWIPLFAGVENVVWKFKRDEGDWLEEWPSGSGRPRMVRVTFDYTGTPGRPVDAQFWVPQVEPPPNAAPANKNEGNGEGDPSDETPQGGNKAKKEPTPANESN